MKPEPNQRDSSSPSSFQVQTMTLMISRFAQQVTTQTGGRCGICGDPYTDARPRPHETGGHMVVNRTVKNYFPGSTMDVLINLDTNHGGYFEFELCHRDSFDTIETDDCFQRLKFADGSQRLRLRTDHTERGVMSMSLVMPEDLRECRACILRWNYRAGNNWGLCPDGTSGTGCGPQELYRNCADISISYQIYQLKDGKIRSVMVSEDSMRRRMRSGNETGDDESGKLSAMIKAKSS